MENTVFGILHRISAAREALRYQMRNYVDQRITEYTRATLRYNKAENLSQLSAYDQGVIERSYAWLEKHFKEVQEVLDSMEFLEFHVRYRGIVYSRYQERKNLSYNQIEALEEKLRDYDMYASIPVFGAYKVYAESVRDYVAQMSYT